MRTAGARRRSCARLRRAREPDGARGAADLPGLRAQPRRLLGAALPQGLTAPPGAARRAGCHRPASPLSPPRRRRRSPGRARATTSGSRSVVTSPSARPSAMSRSSRRMILPERVFGRSSAQMIRFGRANLPIRSATVSRIPSSSSSVPSVVALERHERADRLTGLLVGLADHRRLGDRLVGDDRRLDLGRREPVARDVDDVVDPPDHPEVAVLVPARRVADEVGLLAEAREVRLDEALVVACTACAASTATAA